MSYQKFVFIIIFIKFTSSSSSTIFKEEEDEDARGRINLKAQCHATCHHFINNQNNILKSIEEENLNSTICDGNPNTTNTCYQCLKQQKKNICNNFCNDTSSHTCSSSCECIIPKLTDIDEQSINNTNGEWNNTNLQYLCRDIQKKMPALKFKLNNIPTSEKQLIYFVQYKYENGTWKELYIPDTSTITLTGLHYNKIYTVKVDIYDSNGFIAGPFIVNDIPTFSSVKYAPKTPENVHIANFIQNGDYWFLNVTWTSKDDMCCHYSINFIDNKPNSKKVCQGENWMLLSKNVSLGQHVQYDLFSRSTSGTKSRTVIMEYDVPECPIIDNTTINEFESSKFCIPPKVPSLCSIESLHDNNNINFTQDWLYDINITWTKPLRPVDNYIVTVKLFGNTIKTLEETIPGNETEYIMEGIDIPQQGYEVIIKTTFDDKLGQEIKLRRIYSPTATHDVNITTLNNNLNNQDCPNIVIISLPPTSMGPTSASTGTPMYVTPANYSLLSIVVMATILIIIIIFVALLTTRRRDRIIKSNNNELYEHDKFLDLESVVVDNVYGKKMQVYEPLNTDKAYKIVELNDNEKHMHVSINNIKLGKVLGQGAFGIVRKAEMRRFKGASWNTVAVKMLKEDASEQDKREIQREINLMKSVGKHAHLVCMIAYNSPKDKTTPFIVVEHCELGDLQYFLRKQVNRIEYVDLLQHTNTHHDENFVTNYMYDFTKEKEVEVYNTVLTQSDLLSMARQVAMGMEYLSSNRVVHRDLAARNILVTKDLTVKIADFGLSRDVYEQNVYRKKSEGKLPIKWMAIESLLYQTFTTASDVWSYGILLWEIVTLGGSPYPGIQTCDVFKLLLSGYRMEKPNSCNEKLYSIMLSCWENKPSERPNFTQLRDEIEQLLETCSTSGTYLPLDYAQPIQETLIM